MRKSQKQGESFIQELIPELRLTQCSKNELLGQNMANTIQTDCSESVQKMRSATIWLPLLKKILHAFAKAL